MPRQHEPSKVSRALTQDSSRVDQPGNGHLCAGSPTGSHRWSIGTPNGDDTSTGVCRYCGERKQFANSLEVALGVKRAGL